MLFGSQIVVEAPAVGVFAFLPMPLAFWRQREPRVSRSEAACPCGVGVSFGATLLRIVRVTSAVEKRLTE